MLQIPCPKCESVLRLRDRSLLGKTGKCPKCGHRFTLTDPDEVELELAPPVEEPVRVGAARRVPDAATVATGFPAGAFPPSEPAAFPFAAAESDPPAGGLPFGTPMTTTSPLKELKQRKRKQAKQKRFQIVLGGLIALAVGGLLYAAMDYQRQHPTPVASDAPPPPTRNVAYESARDDLEQTATLIAADAPTQGEPVSLRYIPAGASIVVHLRPAELWTPGTIGEEVRFCLGPLGKWTGEELERLCLYPPEAIEEATVALILGSRGSTPSVAAVARLKEGIKRSELITRFGGSLTDTDGTPVFFGDERAFLFGKETDEQGRPLVVATAPAFLASDLAASAGSPGITSDSVRRLLEHTDRQRQVTLLFQPIDLRIHEATLIPALLRPALSQMLDRLGESAEAVCWSLHFGGGSFDSELLVRNDPLKSPKELLTGLRGRLDEVPTDLVGAVSKMDPAELGRRKLIGRLPAMTSLFTTATLGGIDDRLAVLQTRLPERAGPNLAIAGLLAWDESTRTDFTKRPSAAPTTTPTAPKTLAERLKKPIEIDFRRMPLADAFAYLSGETGVTFDIDGDALKLAGYTKNMPQTFNLGTVPAEQAVAAILAQYEKMCVVLDEAAGTAIVMTRQVAQEKGLTPAVFTP